MPPQISPTSTRVGRYWLSQLALNYCRSCSTCKLAGLRDHRPTTREKPHLSRRISRQLNLASHTTIEPDRQGSTISEQSQTLKGALIDLQRDFRNYVNLSQLQLALRGLEQSPGEETIRIAIIGLADHARTSTGVRELVRALLADPLKDEEEWERILTAQHDSDKPMLLRIGEGTLNNTIPIVYNRVAKELSVSLPTLNSHRLEILVLESGFLGNTEMGSKDLDNMLLVPSIEIPTSSSGRYTPITTPVHKALVVGDGILGAASLLKLATSSRSEMITFAVDFPSGAQFEEQELPFQVTDIAVAKNALKSLRKSLDNAMIYEHEWFKSGIPELLDWVKAGTGKAPYGSRKAPLLWLIQSVLTDASRRISEEESRRISALLSSKVSSSALNALRAGLKEWAERAHTELRDQLDIAFEGRRWRRLRWWKLFWRVDDVSMIGHDILNQRYLVEAEKDIIFLAGRIEEAGIFKARPPAPDGNWAYKPVPELSPTAGLISPPPTLRYKDILDKPQDGEIVSTKPQPWPPHIPISRVYLSMETVPALQVLAQKLVFQTLTTSSFATAFATLIYTSTLSSTYFEVGGIVALGIVWSLRRMQHKWETAREFWEKEVGETGRKAVRAVEGIVNDVLADQGKSAIDGAEELDQAKRAVERAREALERDNLPSNN